LLQHQQDADMGKQALGWWLREGNGAADNWRFVEGVSRGDEIVDMEGAAEVGVVFQGWLRDLLFELLVMITQVRWGLVYRSYNNFGSASFAVMMWLPDAWLGFFLILGACLLHLFLCTFFVTERMMLVTSAYKLACISHHLLFGAGSD
jgi:hypothetical protein